MNLQRLIISCFFYILHDFLGVFSLMLFSSSDLCGIWKWLVTERWLPTNATPFTWCFTNYKCCCQFFLFLLSTLYYDLATKWKACPRKNTAWSLLAPQTTTLSLQHNSQIETKYLSFPVVSWIPRPFLSYSSDISSTELEIYESSSFNPQFFSP